MFADGFGRVRQVFGNMPLAPPLVPDGGKVDQGGVGPAAALLSVAVEPLCQGSGQNPGFFRL